jgi:tetratricopeptide (TPR) repeat protein
VHRDIKPDNVLISGGAAVVTDFGIAKAISASRTGGGATLTQLGTSIGTPAYISPEQAAGDPDIDHRADIYSFGCMAFELLTGRAPFIARTPQRLLAAHMSEAPQPITELRPDTPPALAAMVMRCLEKDASARPQTAAELFPALDATPTSDAGHAAMPSILLGGRGMLKKALAAYAAAFIIVAVVAKAAIVGIGLPDWVFPGALVVMALGLPVILFTAYTQYVARRAVTTSPTFTPGGTQNVPGGTMATIAIKASPHVSWRRTAMGGVYAVGAFILAIGVFMALRAAGIGPAGSLISAGAIGKNEKILVGDFSARTADTTLGGVVSEAFRTSLGQSQSITIMQPTAVREVLTRMQRLSTSHVDFALAREIATREGLKAVVDGEILGVGGSYTISAKLVSVQTGEPLASFTEAASEAKDILPAIDKLSKRMRARIGESLRKVQSTPVLEQVTTPSLEALKKYVQGADALQATGDYAKGVALLEDAIRLDTGFAMAYRKLAQELNNRGGQTARVMDLLQRAYDHRDRLSDAERYLMIGDYFQSGPKQDVQKAINAYESLLAMQPNHPAALNNVANLYRALRDFPKAELYYTRTIANNPPVAVFYNNLMNTYVSLGKMTEAEATLRQFRSALPTNPIVVSNTARMLVLGQHADSASLVLESAIRERTGDVAARGAWAGIRADIAFSRGQLAEAERWYGETRRWAMQRGVRSAALVAQIDSAWSDIWYRDRMQSGVRRLDAALKAHPLDSLPIAERPYANLVFLYAAAGQADRARELATAFEKTRGNIVQIADTITRHVMAGDIATAERRYPDAAREYRIADVGSCTICALPRIAQAYDLAGQPDSAIAVFTRYIETPYFLRSTTDATYLAGAYKRLGELLEQKGEPQKAATYYTKFVELWKNADPELQPKVAEVKKRLAALSNTEKR